MGLDTSHDAWHGPYSSFNEWRRWAAAKVNIDLYSFQGYGGNVSWDTLNHPLKPLLLHSDCDGELNPEECTSVAIGLDEVLSKKKADDFPYFYYEKATQFMNACKLAASRKENIQFH